MTERIENRRSVQIISSAEPQNSPFEDRQDRSHEITDEKCRTDLQILSGTNFKISMLVYNADQNPAKTPNRLQISYRRSAGMICGDSISEIRQSEIKVFFSGPCLNIIFSII
jgi:hypothetical protein